MVDNRLQVIIAENTPEQPVKRARGQTREEKIAKLERLWLTNPEQFDPNRNAIEKLRIKRTLELIQRHINLSDKKAIDLGCAGGTFSRLLRDAGATVTALDAAANALKVLQQQSIENIKPVQDCLPHTSQPEDAFDVVACTDVIAYLQPIEFRLLLAELSRVVTKEGWIVTSTPFDLHTMDGPEEFHALAETEIQVAECVLSYHYLALKLFGWLESPQWFVDGRQAEKRAEHLAKRKGLRRWWYQVNTSIPLVWLWKGISFVTNPLANSLKQSEGLVRFLEKICRFFWDTAGISHLTVIGKRRPLVLPPKPEMVPRESKPKRSVWE